MSPDRRNGAATIRKVTESVNAYVKADTELAQWA
jgi:hypothetical protein